MRSARRAVWVTAVIAATLVAPAVANADERTCNLDPVSGLLKCTLVASPAPPLERRLGDDLPLVWRRMAMNVGELIARGIGCVREVGDITEIGSGYVVSLVNEATQELLYIDYICQWPGEQPPQPPPPPPTPGELRDANAQVLALDPVASPDPAIGGLTGLDSWFWCEDPGEVATGVNLRGWTASGQVSLVYVGWSTTGPAGMSQSSTSCGSQESPSVTWTPETKGTYQLTLTSTWAGTWDLSWNGIPVGAFPLGPISLTSAPQPYPVDEYRGELTS